METPIAFALQARDGDVPTAAPADLAAINLDTHFGRARAFVLLTAAGEPAAVVANEHAEAAHGAGTATVGLLADRGVRTVVAADFGPNAWRALRAARIEAFKAPAGTPLDDCLRRLQAGELAAMSMDVFE